VEVVENQCKMAEKWIIVPQMKTKKGKSGEITLYMQDLFLEQKGGIW